MKTRSKILTTIAVILGITIAGAAAYWFSMPSEQRNMVTFMMLKSPSYDGYQQYDVIERNKAAPTPSSFEPTVAQSPEGDRNSNITVITEMVRNEKSKMLKKATVQVNGAGAYTGWQIIADEGFEEGVNSFGPSPLSYLTSGIAANLHSKVLIAADVLDVELDDVKVEVLNKFSWENMMSAEAMGFVDNSQVNIIIKSSAPEETIRQLKNMALKAWTAGEALANEITIEPSLVVNGEHWEKYRATPGTTDSDVSTVNGVRLSYITDSPLKSDYLPQADTGMSGKSMDDMSNLKFQILATSESAGNANRPQLKKITVSFNAEGSETWELLSDELSAVDSSDVIPVAPTSLEYVTAGTALCLTSQTTLVSTMMNLDFTDYRVEQQINYREEAVNTVDMASYADLVKTSVMIESDESKERLERFFKQSLSMCFAGEGFSGATDMMIHSYLNGQEID